jgi:predicted acyltransferase (DUF342 family)
MPFDRSTLIIPNATKFDDHTIITKGDVVIGDRSLIQFGIRTDGRVFVGEHVIIDGEINASNDIRVDIFSNIRGNIKCGGNVYLGDKVKINGNLSLKGDLNVGDSVDIEGGFEAKGWINIRSPIPIVIYIFIYLIQLLKLGHSEEIDRILTEFEESDGNTIPISENFLFIPNNSIIGFQKSKFDGNIKIGKRARLSGNFSVKGNVIIEEHSELFGSIKSNSNIFCGSQSIIHGNFDASGDVRIDEKCSIGGDVKGNTIFLSRSSFVKGEIFAKNRITFMPFSEIKSNEKVKHINTNDSIIDEIDNLLE